MSHKCPWCKRRMRVVNKNGVYECLDCKVLVHQDRCSHTIYKRYHNRYFRMKQCSECRQYFEVERLRPVEEIKTRIKIFRDFADRLEVASRG